MTAADGATIPWKTLSGDLGDVPFYVITYNKHGGCTSPRALEELIEASKSRTDIFVFSHGWNNDWQAATSRYDRFVQEFVRVIQQQWKPPRRAFVPVLVGVFWPSAALVAPWERGPAIAGGGPPDPEVVDLAAALDPTVRDKFLKITADPGGGDVGELARLLAPVVSTLDDELDPNPEPITADDLIAIWQSDGGSPPQGPARDPGGFIDEDPSQTAEPTAAWANPLQAIRNGIRLTTVRLMKDRAGRVGGTGVASMVSRLAQESSDSRIHVIGHSYGCKVVLSAVCAPPAPGPRIDSVLLLQAALSCFAFTANLGGRPGGYRNAFERVRLPIITTYSRHDDALRKLFHFALFRKSDLAEAVIAAPGQPPSKYAALGGYGPFGTDIAAEWIDMPAVGQSYPLSTTGRIIAVDGSRYIPSHGAVEKPETAWALLSQIRD